MTLCLGNTNVNATKKDVKGGFIVIDGEKFYQITNYDAMQAFFISIASESNLWMYLSSTGGLTAGRINPDTALFPYYTDDKITEGFESTGSKTILHVKLAGKEYLWEPFSNRNAGVYKIERRIAKSTIGNKILFIEQNFDLGLTFQYAWMNADAYGWIKKSKLVNDSNDKIEVEIIDGVQNVLPSGVDQLTQNKLSTLVDAYKKTELVADASMALFRMESILVDRAEPSESLRANVIWNYGLDKASYLLSSRQLDAFRAGLEIEAENEAKGVRGAFLAHTSFTISSKTEKTWFFVAEVSQDAVQVRNCIAFLKNEKNIPLLLEQSIAKGTAALNAIVGEVDGIQETADDHGMARHFANVLFNTMRGGFYCDNYNIFGAAFAKHVKIFNTKVAARNAEFLKSLPETLSYKDLESAVLKQKDKQLYRLFQEYLPLTFSRRHGDPSRPWNMFNIKVNDENGNKLISYQGNWRDIFQNWEALSLSYPEYINGIIAKFFNATTADGYNPYKVTSEGIDWEIIEPENPWSNIGYWGDHQMIYLLKLMELSRKYYPEALGSSLNDLRYAFANVPYRLKSYSEIVADPKNSITFEDKLHNHIFDILPAYGSDARLMLDKNDEVILASFTEKLLATLLAKLSNFIPEAGIWMNTLRPEWNDANNALVGYGASMVTLYYMRRFVAFSKNLFAESNENSFEVSAEMESFFNGLSAAFEGSASVVKNGFNDKQRRVVVDALGKAGEAYRSQIYKGFTGKKQSISKAELVKFFETVLSYIDESIRINKREDGMYHSYNLVSFGEGTVSVNHLYEMLEGQVAVLTSMELSASEACSLLDSLRKSSLYRADQNSYILYPNKRLASFLEKNNLPNDAVSLPVVKQLLAAKDGKILSEDHLGGVHFNANFNNAGFLSAALDKLPTKVSEKDRQLLLDIYEKIFDHKSFTGRSGSFYKYEGLGSIYWHMVSKLLLAIGENIQKAMSEGADANVIARLKAHYAAVKDGIGAHKSPENYGSFPFDPYSHTPIMAGVQQPGMTGQVKEDIINRFFELGIFINNACLSINKDMLNYSEFIKADVPYIKFTYCSIPFTYLKDGKEGIDVIYADKSTERIVTYALDQKLSARIFARDSDIKGLIVHL
ncbi:MAG: hypothetical protein KBA02_04345 [Paludibacteraceae bacterium]|nr:hypothetical protein [Paludibacteraceae bacterium]OQA44905.1 MAG: hypothetical protein BWY47_02156 [Bacteroidetes bacterium ADurb.Bin302]